MRLASICLKAALLKSDSPNPISFIKIGQSVKSETKKHQKNILEPKGWDNHHLRAFSHRGQLLPRARSAQVPRDNCRVWKQLFGLINTESFPVEKVQLLQLGH